MGGKHSKGSHSDPSSSSGTLKDPIPPKPHALDASAPVAPSKALAKVDFDSDAHSGIAKHVSRFTLKIAAQLLRSDCVGDNLFVSGVSIYNALFILVPGLTFDGPAYSDLSSALGISSLDLDEQALCASIASLSRSLALSDPNSVDILVANSLWTKGNVLEEYKRHISDWFEADSLELSTPEAVNAWVNEKTRGLIPEVVDSVPEDSGFIIVNAIYFKGSWKFPFDRSNTIDNVTFHTSPDEDVMVSMMMRYGFYQYVQTDRFQAISLPFGSASSHVAKYFALVMLPKDGLSVRELAAGLCEEGKDILTNPLSSLSMQEGTLWLPRFTLTYPMDGARNIRDELGDTFGISSLFDDSSQLNRMITEDSSISVSTVLHKAVLKVDEVGAEAAAVTIIDASSECDESTENESFEMRVDRPFLFAIYHGESRVPLFFGIIERPGDA